MRKRENTRGEGGFKVIISLAILIVVVIASFKIIPIHLHGNEIYDTMSEQANFGGMKAPEKIQYEVFRKAQEVGAPLPLTEIKVIHRGPNIVISAKYSQTVDVLGYKYRYDFDRTVEKIVF